MGQGALADTMGIEVTAVDDDGTVRARMPVAGNTQPFGLLHGGATAVLVESVGSIASAVAAGPGSAPLGIELSVTHHKGARSGHVHAHSEAVAVGRTLMSFVIPVVDDDGNRIATGRLTCLIRTL